MSYTSPCGRCEKGGSCRNENWECPAYRMWINWNWARFRRRLERRTPAREKFRYAHPGEAVDLTKSPCEKCREDGSCDVPCRAYLAWYDGRMALVRQRLYGGFTGK